LSDEYNYTRLFSVSSQVNRTYLSADYLFSGLYPIRKKGPIIPNNLNKSRNFTHPPFNLSVVNDDVVSSMPFGY